MKRSSLFIITLALLLSSWIAALGAPVLESTTTEPDPLHPGEDITVTVKATGVARGMIIVDYRPLAASIVRLPLVPSGGDYVAQTTIPADLPVDDTSTIKITTYLLDAARGRTVTSQVVPVIPAPVLVPIPDVVGVTQADAKAELVAAGLTVGEVTTANSDTLPAGDVVSQNPAAGASVEAGSPVDLVISLGSADAALSSPIVDVSETMTISPDVTVFGTAPGASEVLIQGGANAVRSGVAGGSFSALVTLKPNMVNHLFVTGIAADGTATPPTPITVVQDGQPPKIFIDFPGDGTDLTTDVVDVAGRVSDTLSGFRGLNVSVNGLAAEVIVGIGTNGTFERTGVPLALGANTISAVAVDELGNVATTSITVNKVAIPASVPTIQVVSGNGQKAAINQVLAEPVIVKVSRSDGSPFPNKLVTFKVTRSNGRLTGDGTGDGSMMLQVRADANGMASAFWKLGSDAGCGNNRLACTSRDVVGSTFFCASADPGPPVQINIGGGSNQRAEAGGPVPEPLRVWVNDTCNGVAGVPVTFNVIRGGGAFPDGSTSTTLTTSQTGHAEVGFILGPDQGNNVVEADFPGNPGNPAAFVLFGVVRDKSQPTSFSGIVLDNSSQPIGGAECSLVIGNDPPLMTFTDVQGQFRFDDLANSGPADLFIDGLVATTVGGNAIPPGSYPSLHFEPVVVPNADNALPVPVLLPALNPANARNYDGTQDLELTVEGVDGVKMLIKAGSMTRADGTVPSPSDPAVLALNQVHFDKVPMPMPDGAAPPFAWTLQPGGALFDPPVQITYPNMSALPAGAIAYFLSFNHDTGKFEIVATGSVTDDASEIVTDPGAGISVAGWGCNCPPYTSTADCEGCTFTCKNKGTLQGGTVDVDKELVCKDESITFTASGVTHVGGELEKDCPDSGKSTVPIAGTPKYSWKITGPETLSGDGATATVTKAKPGTYTCTFTAKVEDPPGASVSCVPADKTLPAKTSKAVDDDGTEPTSVATVNYLALISAGTPSGYGVTIEDPPVIDITAYCDSSAGVWKCRITQADQQGKQSSRVAPSTEVSSALVAAETVCSELDLMLAGLKTSSCPTLASPKYFMLAAVEAHENVHVTQYRAGLDAAYATFRTTVEALTVPLKDHDTAAAAKAAILALSAYTTAKATFDAAELKANNDTANHLNCPPFQAAADAAVAGRITEIEARKTTLSCP